MKERPIIFDATSMAGILDGSKTSTMRLRGLEEINREPNAWKFVGWHDSYFDFSCDDERVLSIKCPFGIVGDRLWTKETWRTWANNDADTPSEIAEKCIDAGYRKPWAFLEFSGGKQVNWNTGLENTPGRWRNAMHQPRWASRATLEIQSIRVMRVQEISLVDIASEGIRVQDENWAQALAKAWAARWDSINGGKPRKNKPDCSFAANPWAWQLSFGRVEK